MGKLPLHTPDFTKQNVGKIAELFPNRAKKFFAKITPDQVKCDIVIDYQSMMDKVMA